MTAIPHIGFILAAYAVTAIVLAAMAAVLAWDGGRLRRALDRLEKRSEREAGR